MWRSTGGPMNGDTRPHERSFPPPVSGKRRGSPQGGPRKQNAEGIGLGVLDNADEHPCETRPYTDAARAAGYRILFLNFRPRSLEAHLAAQQVTPEKPDAHQVPEDSLREHIVDFLAYDDLLRPDAVPDPARHANYRWDEETLSLVRLDTPVVPFDFDDVIRVGPGDYHALKGKIGEMVLKRMRR